jgi:hypothetical protein
METFSGVNEYICISLDEDGSRVGRISQLLGHFGNMSVSVKRKKLPPTENLMFHQRYHRSLGGIGARSRDGLPVEEILSFFSGGENLGL